MKNLLTSILIILLGGINLQGQSAKINGSVQSNEASLPYANIQVENTATGVSTDENGAYELQLVPGTYQITASYIGFEQQTQTIAVQADEAVKLDFTLKSSLALDEIVVTGTMKPTFVSASPIKIDVVTAKQLETYLPSAASSIVESIQLINGVQEVVACGVCFTNNISINGLPGAYTAILMDGTPIYGNLASVYGLNGIPNMIIDRFEVIKGPSSTLYGSEAVAGVINIITKNPEDQPLVSADIMGTTNRESFGNIAVAPKIGKSSGFIGLNYAFINDFEDFNDDGFGDGINLDRYSLFTKWNIARSSNKLFTIAGKYYYEDRRNGVEAFLKDRAYRDLRGDENIYGESIYTNRAEIFGTYEFNTSTDLKLDFSLSHHLQDSYYGSDHYTAEQSIAFSNLLWNLPFKQHDVLIGATSRWQYYDDNTVATASFVSGESENTPDRQFIPGIFIQDEWTINKKWTLLGGARLDHYNSHGLIFAPRLNAKFKPSPWTTLRANFGTGFRVVNLFTEDHAFVTGQRTVEIIEELKPEQSYNAAFNINQVYNIGSSAGTIDLEGFYTYFTNKIIPDYEQAGKIIYANSEGYAQTMGLGVTINHTFLFPLSFNLGFNVQSVTQTEPDGNGNNETTFIEYAPRWSGVLSINYHWKKPDLVIAATSNLTGVMELPEVFDLDENGIPFTRPRPTTSDPFLLQSIQVSKTLNANWSFYLGIQNLFNYRQAISPLVGFNDPNAALGFSAYFDTAYAYSSLHARELYLGVKWNLNRNQ